MPSNYPSGFDDLNNPEATDKLNTSGRVHHTQHTDANDAIESIEHELGTNPSGSYATVADRLDALEVSSAPNAAQIAASDALSRPLVLAEPSAGVYHVDSSTRLPAGQSSNADDTTFDLRGVTIETSSPHPADMLAQGYSQSDVELTFRYGGKYQPSTSWPTKDNLAFVGGYIYMDPVEVPTEDTPWQLHHHACGLQILTPNAQVIGMSFYNTGDALAFNNSTTTNANNWKVIGCRADGPVGGARHRHAFIGDDWIENDAMWSGEVTDVLANGVMDFLSCQSSSTNGTGQTVTLTDCWVRPASRHNSYHTYDYGFDTYHGLFKWAYGAAVPPNLVVQGTFFLFADQLPAAYSSYGLDLPPDLNGQTVTVDPAAEVTLVWGGPAADFAAFYNSHTVRWRAKATNLTIIDASGDADPYARWDTAADDWRARHASLEMSSSGLDVEAVQDIVGAAVQTNINSGLTATYLDTSGVVELDVSEPFATGTQLAANATSDRSRGNHTGTQPASTISDFANAVSLVVGSVSGGTVPTGDFTRVASQTVPNETWTPIVWTEFAVDNDNIKTPATPERLSVPTPGRYSTVVQVAWANNLLGSRRIRLTHHDGGSDVIAYGPDTPALKLPAGEYQRCEATAVFDSPSDVAGQYIVAEVWQDSGGALDLVVDDNCAPRIYHTWIGKYAGGTQPPPPPGSVEVPDMIIGVFQQPAASLAGWAAAGINTAYDVPAGENIDDWTSAANAADIRMIRQPRAPLSGDDAETGLIAWSHLHVPDSVLAQLTWESCQANYAAWHTHLTAAQINRQVFVAVIGSMNQYDVRGPASVPYSGVDWYSEYFAAADWCAGTSYPINRQQTFRLHYERGQSVASLAGTSKRAVEFVELSDQDPAADGPAPTPEQVRAEVWMAVAAGCRGIVYNPRVTTPDSADGSTAGMISEITSINALLTTLGPVLVTAPNPNAMSIVPADPNVVAGWRVSTTGQGWIFTQNITGNTISTQLNTAGVSDAVAPVYGESRNVTPSSGVISDTWAPWATHIYQVVPGTPPPPQYGYPGTPQITGSGDGYVSLSWAAAVPTPATYTIISNPAAGTSPTIPAT